MLVVVVAARPTPASACSCALTPDVSPADGTTDVPLNAKVIVRSVVSPDASVVLEDVVTGDQVPVTAELQNVRYYPKTYIGTPSAPLAPNTTYRVTLTNAGGTTPSASSVFTTGTQIDGTPPAFAGLLAVHPEAMRYPDPGSGCISSCFSSNNGYISRLRLELADLPPDVVHAVLELYRPGDTSRELIPLDPTSPWRLGFDGCGPSPTLELDADYCARVVVYDVAGNLAGHAAEVCAPVQTCAPHSTESCEPSDLCLAETGCSSTPDPLDLCVDTAGDDGGCATTRGPGWLLALSLLVRRRRR